MKTSPFVGKIKLTSRSYLPAKKISLGHCGHRIQDVGQGDHVHLFGGLGQGRLLLSGQSHHRPIQTLCAASERFPPGSSSRKDTQLRKLSSKKRASLPPGKRDFHLHSSLSLTPPHLSCTDRIAVRSVPTMGPAPAPSLGCWGLSKLGGLVAPP